jgi:hypothetical protein
MLTGIFSTLLLPETKVRTLEEISNEDQEGFVQGESDFTRVKLEYSQSVVGGVVGPRPQLA